VQVRGKLTVLDKEGLWNSVKTLMHTYESKQENPVRMEDLSEKTLKQMNGIMGFEIAISSIEAAHKLSQNRDDKNHAHVVDHLRKSGDTGSQAVADEMDRLRNK
jgi:transcriptional regulator